MIAVINFSLQHLTKEEKNHLGNQTHHMLWETSKFRVFTSIEQADILENLSFPK